LNFDVIPPDIPSSVGDFDEDDGHHDGLDVMNCPVVLMNDGRLKKNMIS
jgi:hypothetical protein